MKVNSQQLAEIVERECASDRVVAEREVMVLPCNGDRFDDWTLCVVSLENAHGIAMGYRVTNGVGYSALHATEQEAFSDALAHAAWNARCVERFA